MSSEDLHITNAANSSSRVKHAKQSWEEMRSELREYRRRFGDCNVHTHSSKLDRWVSTQRARHKKGGLSIDQVADLESMGFTWQLQDTYAPAQCWRAMYDELIEYKAQHGHCNVPALKTKLGRWVTTQRSRRAGTCSEDMPLNEKQIALLDEIGFAWRLGATVTQQSWEDSFAQLQAFHQEHGHTILPTTEEYHRLRNWVGTQREKRKKGCLPDEYIQKLDGLGFTWEFFVTETWDSMYQKLQAFYEEHGHSKVPINREGKLGCWVTRQRMRKRGTTEDRTLSAEQIEKLDALDFCWDAADYDEIWMEWFEKLKEFKEANGHCRVPRLSGPLGAWVARQRQCRDKNSGSNRQLTAAQIEQLDSIECVWRADDNIDSWEVMYEKLVAYHQEHGDHLVPQKSNGKLGSWVMIQRSRRYGMKGRQKQLTEEQVQLLNDLNFAWNLEERNQQLWTQMYRQLEAYKTEHGHCRVPTRYKGDANAPARLGKWVEQQWGRRNGQKGKSPLTEDEFERLDALGFVWEVKKPKNRPTSARKTQEDQELPSSNRVRKRQRSA